MLKSGARPFAWVVDAHRAFHHLVTGSGEPITAPSPQKAAWAPTILVVITTIGLLAYFTGPLNPDVSGQFWLAHSMRNGARLYTDMIEINPPLWFWMALPIDWFAEKIGVRTEPVTIIVIATLVMGAVHASRRVLMHGDVRPPTAFFVYMAAILLIMPLQHLEQREHLALIGAVPYLVLASVRRQGRTVHPALALMIGLGAALGLCLKPYFLAVPLLTEAWLLIALKRQWRPFRGETIALGATGLLYAAAIITFAPEYVTVTVPLLVAVYEAASAPIYVIFDVMALSWLCMLAAISSHRRAIWSGGTPLTVAFLLGGAGFAFAFVIQHKGWFYQGLPAAGCFALALAAVLAEAGRPASFARLFVPGLLVWPLAFPIGETEMRMTMFTDINYAFEELEEGDAFGLVSTIGATTWPSTVNRGLRRSSRYGQFWMLAALDARPRDPVVQRVARQAVRDTVLDYRCLPPKIIVFTRFDRRRRRVQVVDDPYRYFMRDPEFAALLGHYRLSKQYGMFDVYRQVTPLAPPDPRTCRHPG